VSAAGTGRRKTGAPQWARQPRGRVYRFHALRVCRTVPRLATGTLRIFRSQTPIGHGAYSLVEVCPSLRWPQPRYRRLRFGCRPIVSHAEGRCGMDSTAIPKEGYGVLSDDIVAFERANKRIPRCCRPIPHLCLWPDAVPHAVWFPRSTSRNHSRIGRKRRLMLGKPRRRASRTVPFHSVPFLFWASAVPIRRRSWRPSGHGLPLLSLVADTYAQQDPRRDMRRGEFSFWPAVITVPSAGSVLIAMRPRLKDLCQVMG